MVNSLSTLVWNCSITEPKVSNARTWRHHVLRQPKKKKSSSSIEKDFVQPKSKPWKLTGSSVVQHGKETSAFVTRKQNPSDSDKQDPPSPTEPDQPTPGNKQQGPWSFL